MLSTTTSATLIFIRLFLKKISARAEYIKQRNRNLLAREVLIKKGDAIKNWETPRTWRGNKKGRAKWPDQIAHVRRTSKKVSVRLADQRMNTGLSTKLLHSQFCWSAFLRNSSHASSLTKWSNRPWLLSGWPLIIVDKNDGKLTY